MTANSIELLPCQVAPLGLHGAGGGAARMAPASMRPTAVNAAVVAPKLPPKRNLFGSPNRGEIGRIYNRENQENRNYLINRYNFDVRSHVESRNTRVSDVQPEAEGDEAISTTSGALTLPSLIMKEQRQHEKRLLAEKCNQFGDESDSQLLEDLEPNTNGGKRLAAPIKRTVAPMPVSPTTLLHVNEAGNATERCKPYARQTRLTDCFNLRKATKAPLPWNGTLSVVERTAQRELEEVLQQFPKSAVNTNNNSSSTSANSSTSSVGSQEATTAEPAVPNDRNRDRSESIVSNSSSSSSSASLVDSTSCT